MTIHPLPPQTAPDTTARDGQPTAYDSVWAQAEVPERPPEGLERVMLAEDKLYVVLAVVLIIWLGLVAFLFRTDRRLQALERRLDERIPDETRPA